MRFTVPGSGDGALQKVATDEWLQPEDGRNDMTSAATNGDGEERKESGAALAPTWRRGFRSSASDVVTFLNTPTPLPHGAVSVTATAPNQFHIYFFE
jgi:hypothetical protein